MFGNNGTHHSCQRVATRALLTHATAYSLRRQFWHLRSLLHPFVSSLLRFRLESGFGTPVLPTGFGTPVLPTGFGTPALPVHFGVPPCDPAERPSDLSRVAYATNVTVLLMHTLQILTAWNHSAFHLTKRNCMSLLLAFVFTFFFILS